MNNKGIGLIIVLSAIALLTVIMTSFTFDSKINLINSNNMQSRAQAKLNAEAGLRWSLIMMNIYRDLFNKIEVNESIKKVVPTQTLNILWSTPFIFPIPSPESASISQKSTLNEFNQDNFINGEMNVSVKNLSGKLNLNLLRFSVVNIVSQDKLASLLDGNYYDDLAKSPTFQTQFKAMLDNILKDKLESDEEGNEDLENIDTERLINNIIYYTSDLYLDSVAPCPSCADSAQDFSAAFITPKKAPLTSLSELYLIPGWTDKLVKLIQNHVTVHGAIVIDLNEITAEILKLMMPNLLPQEITEFYEYKNNPDTLETFDNIAAIKKYFTANTSVVGTDFDKKIEELEKSGIVFGATASLFEVKSVGKVDRSTYNITAIVTLPQLPKPSTPPAEPQKPGALPQGSLFGADEINEGGDEEQEKKTEGNTYSYPQQLLKPRVIHFSIN